MLSTEFTFGISWIMSFFHQDWTLDAATEAGAVADQFVEELEPEVLLLVRRDARLLLDNLPSNQIKVLWEGCADGGEYFFRRGHLTDGAEWMRQVMTVCDTWRTRRLDTPRLSTAGTYEGRELTEQVLAAVEEFRGVLDWDVAVGWRVRCVGPMREHFSPSCSHIARLSTWRTPSLSVFTVFCARGHGPAIRDVLWCARPRGAVSTVAPAGGNITSGHGLLNARILEKA